MNFQSKEREAYRGCVKAREKERKEILKKSFSLIFFTEKRKRVRNRRIQLSIKFVSPLSKILHHIHFFHSLLHNHHHERNAQCFSFSDFPVTYSDSMAHELVAKATSPCSFWSSILLIGIVVGSRVKLSILGLCLGSRTLCIQYTNTHRTMFFKKGISQQSFTRCRFIESLFSWRGCSRCNLCI